MPKNTSPKKAVQSARAKLKDNPATHAVNKVFTKIGEKTGVNQKKIDEWQTKWLAAPKNRTKYESLKDAPAVIGEELFGITNDIIDFVQGEHGGQSHIFNKMKESVEAGKKKAMEAKKAAEVKAKKAKGAAGKGAGGAGLGGFIAKAKAGIAQAKEKAQKGMAEAKKRVEAKAAEAKKAAGKAKAAAKKVKK